MKKKAAVVIASFVLLLALLSGYVSTEAQATEKNIMQIAQEDGNFTSLVAAVDAAGLDDELSGPGPFTVFAPTDAAFAKLDPNLVNALLTEDTATLEQILLYHVVSGETLSTDLSDGMVVETLQGSTVNVTINGTGVFINDAMVVVADIQASNGVIHVIDTVLIPPAAPVPPEEPCVPEVPTAPGADNKTIVDIAVADGNFTCLVASLEAAGLVDELSGPGPFTVFAPTDAAFAKLDPCVVNMLLTEDTTTLEQILLYHVVSGEVLSTDLQDCQKVVTLQGGEVTIRICDGNVFINDAMVVVADIQASNGVIHVIDTVLMPPVA
ncbi:MAG: fasciclin domain-containing protein [Methanomassiliicoccus sp.]|nr:fasciclin domain-containing protein [Methanomassiliicoccus sp.]